MEETELCFPQLFNSSCRRIHHPYFELLVIYIILFSIALLTVFLNLLVIISISHFRQLHTPTNILLLSLAVSDFLIGFIMIFQIMLMEGCWFLGDIMCALYNCSAYFITGASVGTMVLISIDRYVAICYPLHYSTKMTEKRAKMCVWLCWFCSLMFHCLIQQDNLKQPGMYNSCIGECVVIVSYIGGLTDLIASFILSITVIMVLYLRVFVVAMAQARAMRSHIAGVTFQDSVTANKSEMKAARTLGVVVLVFILCLCPFYSFILTGQDTLIQASSATFVVFLFYFNSSLNPIIYVFFYPWFRKSIRLIVTFRILQPHSSGTNMQQSLQRAVISKTCNRTAIKSV